MIISITFTQEVLPLVHIHQVAGFGPFETFRDRGGESKFFIADNVLYAIGDMPGVLGLGAGSSSVTVPTPVPVPTGEDWDLSKLTCVADMKGEIITRVSLSLDGV